MKKAALIPRTALMILTLTVGFLSIRDADLGIEPRSVSSWDVQDQVELFCWQCGEVEPFWEDYTIDHSGQLTPDDSQQGEGTYTLPGTHGRMTMCLICFTLNGDLPPDDPHFGINLFRLEPCDMEHRLEDVHYESIDAVSHEMTATDVVYCALCGDSRSGGPSVWRVGGGQGAGRKRRRAAPPGMSCVRRDRNRASPPAGAGA